MSKVIENVTKAVTPILEENNFSLYDIEFVQEKGSWYLRIYIDKDTGISIDDCALVSDQLSEVLDEMDPDPIPEAYYLEVSSPGAERPLKKEEDFKNAVGEYIHVSLYQKLNNQKVFEGTLINLTDDELTLDCNIKGQKKQFVIQRDLISKARLAIEF
ncbi:ribosome maturation factor RimP [Lactobacillus sp. S2-2]|uniref:ribosome maturation factor RimP n=1 Tax=Lactobacillus sp. S2-2 TaxID=2692917 RepID=UPI001EFF766E|nr:ribosome maturation factor RimP [Lactobacillus sp. S2-2]